jgi:glycosyltransferase involved in cell wall biosynthesis
MKVLHVIPSLDQGGAEKLLIDIVKSDVKNEHIVVKLVGGSQFFDNQLPGQSYSLNLPRGGVRSLLFLPYACIRLAYLLFHTRPDVVVGWLYYGAVFASIATVINVPVIWSIHTTETDWPFDRPLHLAARLCRFLSQCIPVTIHYCSMPGRVAHEGFGFRPNSSVVVPNGVEVSSFGDFPSLAPGFGSVQTEQRVERLLEDTRRSNPHLLTIGCIAALRPQKDHQTLLAGMALLAASGRSFRLVLAGAGCEPDNPELLRLIDRFELRDHVMALGAVSGIEQVYRNLDCVVLSSSHGESMPLCVLEALSAGKPVVATDVGVTRGMVASFGLVIPPRNPQALADAVDKVGWGSGELKSSAKALAPAYVERHYGFEECAFRWRAMLESLVPRVRHGRELRQLENALAKEPNQPLVPLEDNRANQALASPPTRPLSLLNGSV